MGTIVLKNIHSLFIFFRLSFQTFNQKKNVNQVSGNSAKLPLFTLRMTEQTTLKIAQSATSLMLEKFLSGYHLFVSIELLEIISQIDNKGSIEKKTAVFQLLIYLNEIYFKIHNGEIENVHLIYVDFCKITGKLSQWRTVNQRIKVKNARSEPLRVTTGVQEGWHLELFRFSVYVNVLPKSLEENLSY